MDFGFRVLQWFWSIICLLAGDWMIHGRQAHKAWFRRSVVAKDSIYIFTEVWLQLRDYVWSDYQAIRVVLIMLCVTGVTVNNRCHWCNVNVQLELLYCTGLGMVICHLTTYYIKYCGLYFMYWMGLLENKICSDLP